MKLEQDNAAQCARMAKIRFTAEEEAAYQSQMQSLFDWVEQLSKVDVSGVEIDAAAQAAFLRPDDPVVNPALSQMLIGAFNDKEGACAKVKKVL